jgi:hypothetical protein
VLRQGAFCVYNTMNEMFALISAILIGPVVDMGFRSGGLCKHWYCSYTCQQCRVSLIRRTKDAPKGLMKFFRGTPSDIINVVVNCYQCSHYAFLQNERKMKENLQKSDPNVLN